jgi:CheY-like chemotaxis protein
VKVAMVLADGSQSGALRRRFQQRFPEFSVEVLRSAENALTLFRQDPPNLIVSTGEVAGVSGLELLKRVHGDTALCDVPFILLDETVLDTFTPSPLEVVLERRAHPAVVVAAAASLLMKASPANRDPEEPPIPLHGVLGGRQLQGIKMSGTLEVLSLFDLVLSLTQKRNSGRLYLLLGGTEAHLFFQQGSLVHAAFERWVGEAAVLRIFAAAETHQDAEFYYEPTRMPLPQNGATLTAPVQEVLLRVAIALDQQRTTS